MKMQRIVDSARALADLKDFQRRSVEHAYRELYRKGGSGRFLVADEVGLGKTIVARGIIAKILDLQGDFVKRLDIVYVCSNAEIAQQNINKLIPKLDIPDEAIGRPERATRLTLLPKIIHDISHKRVNFICFTPGTTFDTKKSKQGLAEERAVIYKILEPLFRGKERKIRKIIDWKGAKSFNNNLNNIVELDKGLAARFRKEIRGSYLLNKLRNIVDRYDERRRNAFKDEISETIAALREKLAQVCLDALEPDLVILDEFQRFKDILAKDEDEDSLPSRLFRYSDKVTNANTKVLLLSATPYKMFTRDSDADELENHYDYYLETMRFLYMSDVKKLEKLKCQTREYRSELDNGSDCLEAKSALERSLKRVMCRTERVSLTNAFDAMIKDVPLELELEASDLKEAPKLDELARYLDADCVIPYWGSVPYALNFLRDYDLGKKLKKTLATPGRKSDELMRLIGQIKQFTERMYDNCTYELKPANHRMRKLFERSLGDDKTPLWKLLWLPPSLPYTEPSGFYKGVEQVTKTLVFSAWNAVPDAIATMVSAEAERRMYGHDLKFRHGAKNVFKPRLVYRAQNDGVSGMTTLLAVLPFASLMEYDPLEHAIASGKPVDLRSYRKVVSKKIADKLSDIPLSGAKSGAADSDWYWAAPALMDGSGSTFVTWLEHLRDNDNDDDADGLSQCLAHVKKVLDTPWKLGKRPDDLAEVLADIALSGPGVCAARSLAKVFGLDIDNDLFDAAYKIGNGFRSLFNKYAVVALVDREIKSRRVGYWRKVLTYCADGNVQSLLDEQMHMLYDFGGSDKSEMANKAADDLYKALSIRASAINVQEFPKDKKLGDPFRVACRYAMRFGTVKKNAADDKQVVRSADVRLAFDSPFRPFVLASTSIGQEGLDFHQWCHAVMHWNLPSNPVDLEQREGRVHRYKGHAVRKNIASHYGLKGLKGFSAKNDPWAGLFEFAEHDRIKTMSELVPCWIYEGGEAKIERIVPYVPLSKAENRLAELKRGLGQYRLAFGQPRQEELVALYADRDYDEIRRRTLSLLPDK